MESGFKVRWTSSFVIEGNQDPTKGRRKAIKQLKRQFRLMSLTTRAFRGKSNPQKERRKR